MTQLSYQLELPAALETAREKAEEAISIWRKLPGSEVTSPRDVAASYNSLGNILGTLGDHSGSLNAHRDALRLRQDYAQGDANKSILIAATYLNIGAGFLDRELWSEAEKYLEQSVEVYEAGINAKHVGEGRIGLMRALWGLSDARWKLGKLAKAINDTGRWL